jgi:hypothetical protein
MTSLVHIREEISQISDDEMRDICLRIVDEVGRRVSSGKAANWTFQTFSKWVNRKPSDILLHTCIQLLASKQDARLLDMHFLFFNPKDENDTGEPIEDNLVKSAYKEGYLVNPYDGEKLKNFEASLVPYFVASERLSAR